MTSNTCNRMAGNVIDHFKILEVIYSRGCGQSYKAFNLKTNQTTLLKEIDVLEINLLEEYLKELLSVNHNSVYNVDEYFLLENKLFLVLQYIEGETLESYLKKSEQRHFSPDEVLDIAKQVAAALVFGLGKNIDSYSLKLGHIFLTKDFTVKLLDFGINNISRHYDYQNPVNAFEFGKFLYLIFYGCEIEGNYKDKETGLFAGSQNEVGELNWIIFKCLGKDENNKYKSMDEVLGDLYGIVSSNHQGKHHFNFKSTLRIEKEMERHHKTVLILINSIITALTVIIILYTLIKFLH